MNELLKKLSERKDLTAAEAEGFLLEIMKGLPAQAGGADPMLVASILVALRVKGESVEEIVGFLRAMRANMVKVNAPGAIDVVGTGGDGLGTFNISTVSSFVAAGAGAKIAKHGNRAASGKCGSADVLEALGAHIQLTKEQAEEVYRKVGFVFLMAPLFHPAMKEVGPIRKQLKIRTIFNILGPFANPAGTEKQLVGVPDKELAKKMVIAGKKLGFKRLLIVSSSDGMDEISLSANTYVYDLKGNRIKSATVDPRKFGFKRVSQKEILGGDASENARIARAVLSGEAGPKRDIVILNSAYALVAAGVAASPSEGVDKAKHSIDSGRALGVLDSFVRTTQEFA
ncbi:anthranilate phosphoribosyltransferase [Candidatus Kaiserbacteria bacterium]|nr:anthranilate phosphoribosyltransferase [Candidatus Kaiserbacteria bacterium]